VGGSIFLRAYPNKLFSGILYEKLLRRFQESTEAGIFLAQWEQGLFKYEALKGIDEKELAIDKAVTKTPMGGKQVGKNPTDRAKIGPKGSAFRSPSPVPSPGGRGREPQGRLPNRSGMHQEPQWTTKIRVKVRADASIE
jgi:hypothetical protein